jgi:shikimate kinase
MSGRSDTDDDEYRAGHIRGPQAIRLVGPGGAGKSTIGALLAERLELAFIDLDRHLAGRIGDIGEYIGRHGYDAYARENVETYCSLFRPEIRPAVVALSSGFMTYARDIHPEYSRVRRDLSQHPNTFVLLPSFDRDVCVAETVRRQIARPFGRPSAQEEAVIRARFEIYMSVPVRKIETMRPAAAAVAEILAALSLEKK